MQEISGNFKDVYKELISMMTEKVKEFVAGYGEKNVTIMMCSLVRDGQEVKNAIGIANDNPVLVMALIGVLLNRIAKQLEDHPNQEWAQARIKEITKATIVLNGQGEETQH